MGSAPHVALSGMMGTGKSTVGALVAQQQGWPFVDLDARIEDRAGASIPTLFAERGEAVFRRLEHEALLDALSGPQAVIALGGGTVTNLRNREALRAQARILTLTASPERLIERIGDDAGRPLLAALSPEQRLKRLREMTVMRARAYTEADALIDTEDRAPAAVAEQIMAQLWAWGIHPAAGRAR